MYAENLIGVTQNFLKPDIVNKFSRAIGETTEKTQRGLKTVIPTLLMGIVDRGQNKSGAELLVNLVNKDGLEGENFPDYGDANYINKGTDAVQGIFGNKLDSVVSKLGDSTGIQSSGIIKMLKMAAPLIMGLLGTKMKREAMSTPGLMGFLAQQKKALSELLPEGLIGRFTVKNGAATVGQNMARNSRSPTLIVTVFALAIFAALWMFTGGRDLSHIVSAPDSIITTRITPTIDQLLPFLQSGSMELPKAFIIVGSDIELQKIAGAMREFPSATARVEGYTDNTGNERENIESSTNRANALKERLVKLGLSANRIESIGMGSSKPLANNDSEKGRSQNQRIEFVITRIE